MSFSRRCGAYIPRFPDYLICDHIFICFSCILLKIIDSCFLRVKKSFFFLFFLHLGLQGSLSLWSLHILPVPVWVSPGAPVYSLKSKAVLVKLIGRGSVQLSVKLYLLACIFFSAHKEKGQHTFLQTQRHCQTLLKRVLLSRWGSSSVTLRSSWPSFSSAAWMP